MLAVKTVEIGLHLSGCIHVAELIAGHVQTEPGSERKALPVETVVHIHASVQVGVDILGHVEIQIVGSSAHGTGIQDSIVTNEAV